jgi:hypothetical protein
VILRPDPPPEPTYTLILTETELVGLAALSYRHEDIKAGGIAFSSRIPVALQAKVDAQCDMQPEKHCTLTGVKW